MYEYRKLTREQQLEIVRERRKRGYPPHSPPHRVRDQDCYLLTAACYEHNRHMMEPARRDLVLDMLFEQLVTHGMQVDAWIILPNHYHLLVSEADFDALSGVFRAVHGATSRAWNLADETIGRKVWYRFTDRAIRSERHYYTTLNYIHYNPVKHGWAASPYDWEPSSVGWYLETLGREWLRDLWAQYPLLTYGKGWDDERG